MRIENLRCVRDRFKHQNKVRGTMERGFGGGFKNLVKWFAAEAYRIKLGAMHSA